MSGAGFILDLGRCVGCGACVLACRLKNRWPEGVRWRRLLTLNLDRYPSGPTYHFSLACHHCEHPACLPACPSGAYAKRLDGAVVLDGELCLGCRYCEMACPFGAPSFDPAAGIMTKCDLCRDRIDTGSMPACVAACPAEALAYLEPSHRREREESTRSMPGFADPSGCLPNLRFKQPRGANRAVRLGRLQEVLQK